jgi:hypothetical protein
MAVVLTVWALGATFDRRTLLRSASALPLAPLPCLAVGATLAPPTVPQLYDNQVIGFSFTVPPLYARRLPGGVFGLASESFGFGGAVSYDGPAKAQIELTTKTLPPGPTFARLDPKEWTANDAAESVIIGTVLAKSLQRFGDCDAYFFESETEDERGYTACTLKKDKNFGNHLLVLSAHCPTSAFAQSKADLRAAVQSLLLVDFIGDLTAADLAIAKPLGRK